MSELAFNVNGEPFEVLPNMAAWRVRKLKPKGAPEVVYGRDGLPLFLPLDADIEDLRREARGDGRYRLDPVDDHNRSLPNSQAAYVCVHPIERDAEPKAPAAPVAASQPDTTTQLVNALLESQKQHTELARMYVSQFPVIANAMAGVVRSASDAGLTARVPLVLPPAPEAKPDETAPRGDANDDDDQGDESHDDEMSDETDGEQLAVQVAPQPEYSWARVAQTLADHVTPHVGPLLAGLPGLAATLGTKRASTAIDARGPDRQDPVPAEAEAGASSSPLAGVGPGMLIRLNAINAQLTPVEQQFARVLIDEMPAEDLSMWLDRLREMSVDDAVAYVREKFREGQAAAAPARPTEPPATAPSAGPRSAPPRASAPPTAPSATRREARRAPHAPSSPPEASAAPTQVQRPIRRQAPSNGNGLAWLDDGTQAHLAAIDAALTLDEAAALRKQFAALSPRERASWVATLVMLPVAEAIAAIRAQLAAADTSAAAPLAETPSTNAAPQNPPVTPTSAPSNATAPMRRASSAGANAHVSGDDPQAAPHGADQPALHTVSAVSAIETAPALPDPALVTVDRDADSHLAAVEHALIAEERVRMHAMFSRLSPEERETWLDRLLSVPPDQGTAMIREALSTETSQPRLADSERAPTSITTASTDPGDGSEHFEPVVDDIEPDDAAALAGAEPLDTADLDEAQPMESLQPTVDEVNQPSLAPAAEKAASPYTPGRQGVTGDAPQLAGDVPHAVGHVPPLIATEAALATSTIDVHKHFQAIDAALTLAERMRAHELSAQRPAAELGRWYADLLRLSVPDAVTKIRAELARSDGDPRTTKKGGVS